MDRMGKTDNTPQPPATDRFLRLPDVIDRVGLCRASIYNYVKRGHFPQPVDIGPRVKAWSERAINQWIEDRIQGKPLPDALAPADEVDDGLGFRP